MLLITYHYILLVAISGHWEWHTGVLQFGLWATVQPSFEACRRHVPHCTQAAGKDRWQRFHAAQIKCWHCQFLQLCSGLRIRILIIIDIFHSCRWRCCCWQHINRKWTASHTNHIHIIWLALVQRCSSLSVATAAATAGGSWCRAAAKFYGIPRPHYWACLLVERSKGSAAAHLSIRMWDHWGGKFIFKFQLSVFALSFETFPPCAFNPF